MQKDMKRYFNGSEHGGFRPDDSRGHCGWMSREDSLRGPLKIVSEVVRDSITADRIGPGCCRCMCVAHQPPRKKCKCVGEPYKNFKIELTANCLKNKHVPVDSLNWQARASWLDNPPFSTLSNWPFHTFHTVVSIAQQTGRTQSLRRDKITNKSVWAC